VAAVILESIPGTAGIMIPPLGGVAISDAIHQTFTDRAYPGGLTYSGHPLACAAAVATRGNGVTRRMGTDRDSDAGGGG
jgi:adenosylmethionine-8-amino-7-oxononanoate aminotransferase